LPFFLKSRGDIQEGIEQDGAIIVDEFDQSGFLHQSAEFDQMPGACALVLDPLAGILAGACGIEAVTQRGQLVSVTLAR
jgi:hypothetical protein